MLDLSNVFTQEDFVLPLFIKEIDKRGFMYIVQDSVYLEVFKIGRTVDLHKRLLSYNSDKPFKTAAYSYISMPFQDVCKVESIILAQMYKVTNPTSLTKEWFFIEHLSMAKDWIERAERESTLIAFG